MSIFNELGPQNPKKEAGKFSMDTEPIPDGTEVLAYVEKATLDPGNPSWDLEKHIKIQWKVARPDDYKNRVVFHKVRCFSPEQAKRIKQLNMLKAIDANAGGEIAAHKGELSDAVLQKALGRKPMIIKLKVWDLNGKTGNWVSQVGPKPTGVDYTAPAEPAPDKAPESDAISFGDEVPF